MKSVLNGARLSVLSVALCGVFAAYAQTNSNPTLREVVVVASRFAESRLDVPVSVQVISKEDIQNSAAMSVPDALRMLAGIPVRNVVGGQLGLNSAVDLAGYGVTATHNTLVVVDGHRLNPIDSSDIDWSSIPLASVQRIEIAPGGAGVQFGAGASGGVVFITTDGKAAERSQVGVSVGSFGTAQLGLQLDRKIDDVALNLRAGADHSDGWRENARIDGQTLSAKATKELGATGSVFAELVLSHSTNGFSGGVLGQVGSGNQRAAKFNNVGSERKLDQQGMRLGGLLNLSAQTVLDVDMYLGKKNSNFARPYYETPASMASGYPGANALKLDGNELSFSPKFQTEFANGASLVYGYDFSQGKQNGQSNYSPLAQQTILGNQGPFAYNGNLVSDEQAVQLLNHSVYAIGRMPLSQSVELTVGARRQVQRYDSYDLNALVGFALTGSGQLAANAFEAGLNFKLNDSSRTYARLNQSYRFANTDEYWGYDANFNRAFSGELRPQTTRAFEIGYDFKNDRQQFGAVIAQSLTQDEIRYDPLTFQNGNLNDNIARTSLALNWSGRVGDKSHVTAGARFQRAEYANGNFSGQTLGLVPSAVYNLGWIQDLPNRSKAGVQLTHVSKQNYDASPTDIPTLAQMPAYTTADIFWSRSYDKLETKVTVKNIAGDSYAPYGGYGFVSLPGGGSAYRYYYYPADPRSLHVSMTYQF